jgi:hypothetical protein
MFGGTYWLNPVNLNNSVLNDLKLQRDIFVEQQKVKEKIT